MYPPTIQINRQNPMINLYEEVSQRLSTSLGTVVHSGYPAFLNSKDAKENMRWSLTDRHPSCVAHGIFARWVFDKFRDQDS
jgi:hypothetical protein